MTLAFVRLMAAWLLRLASPPCAAGQAVQLPLPTPASVEFRALPVSARTLSNKHATQGADSCCCEHQPGSAACLAGLQACHVMECAASDLSPLLSGHDLRALRAYAHASAGDMAPEQGPAGMK